MTYFVKIHSTDISDVQSQNTHTSPLKDSILIQEPLEHILYSIILAGALEVSGQTGAMCALPLTQCLVQPAPPARWEPASGVSVSVRLWPRARVHWSRVRGWAGP